MKKYFLLFGFLVSVVSTSILAQQQEVEYRVIKMNGKEYKFPIRKLEKHYPYNIELKNVEGDTVFSSEVFAQNDKPTVLLFWVTTCVPCKYEITAILKQYDTWKTQAAFNFYAISVDLPRYEAAFYERVKKENWPFVAYYDFNNDFRNIMPGGLNGVPQTFLLDQNGNLAYYKRKYGMGDEDKLFAEILRLQGD